MKTKHTSGPWTYDPYWSLIMAGNVEIAAVHAAIHPSEKMRRVRLDAAHANAFLLASAPELLDALKECITNEGANCLAHGADADALRRRLESISKTAREAIAKATH